MSAIRPVPAGPRTVPELLPALAAALHDGPALLPLPAGPPAVRDELLATARIDHALEKVPGGRVAMLVPTSGSSGEPKLALLTADALLHSARATLDRLGGPGRWLLALPTTHIAGLQVLIRSLVADTVPEVLESRGFRPAAFAAATARLDAGDRRYTALVPTQLVRILDAGGEALAAAASYDAVLVGGAAAPPPLLERARSAGIRAVVTYGMTETCGGCIYDGTPLDGVAVRVDADRRVNLGGRVVFSGYRLRPDLTAAGLLVQDGTRWHRTGDLGSIGDDGRLRVLGRADDVIVTGGEKVAAPLVEEALADHPGVRQVAVVGRPDAEWGERVVAVVVPADPARPPSLAELRSHAAERLPAYAAPREVVVTHALPWLPSGKVDRPALRRLRPVR